MSIKTAVSLTLVLLSLLGGLPADTLRPMEQTAEAPAGFVKQGNTVILMYHTFVTSGEPTAAQDSLYTTAEKLAADIDALRAAGYEATSLWHYRMGLTDPQKKYFILTFDDGYESNYTVAWPVIEEKKAFADIFANTGMMGEPNHLTWDMCREMEAGGRVRIHSHLDVHEAAAELSYDERKYLLAVSTEAIERELGKKAMWGMSYPYGSYNAEVFDQFRAMGASFQLAQGAQFEHPELLVRINVPYSADIDQLIKIAVHN